MLELTIQKALENVKPSAEKVEKCSAQELFSAFGVSDLTMLE